MFLFIFPLMIGTTEIVLLAAAALLLFGGKKLPQIMRNMGKGVKEFKEGVQSAPENFHEGLNEEKNDSTEEIPRVDENSSEQQNNHTLNEQ